MTPPPITITVADQFAAALSALIPFLLAVLAVGIVIWKILQWAYQWRYDGVIEKLNASLRLAAEENRVAKEKQIDLSGTVASLIKELEKLKGQKADDKRLQPAIQDLSKMTFTMEELIRANTATDEALRRGAAVTTMGSSLFTGQQAVTVQPQVPVGQQWVQPKVPVTGDQKVTVAEKPNVTSRSE